MKVKVRTKDFRLSIPVPVGMVGFVVKLIPKSVFCKMYDEVPEPYNNLITKEFIIYMINECLSIIKEHKGLEIVNVEAADGTYVSIKF